MEDRKNFTPRDGEPVKQTDLKQKRAYVEDLLQSRGTAAIPLLAEMLAHESWTLRDSAASALAGVGHAVVSAVLPMASSGLWYSRAGAARVLGATGGAESVPVLLDMLSESNRTVKTSALEALLHISRRGGTVSIARGLHPRAEQDREPILAVLSASDAAVGAKVRSLLLDHSLMSIQDDDEPWENDPSARRSGGLVWEVLTGGKPPGDASS